WAAPGPVGERRGLVWQPERGSGVWQPGHARKKFSASRRPPRDIHRTGNRGARAFAAGGACGAAPAFGGSARPGAAVAARERARISAGRAARPRQRPRASRGARLLASAASAGEPLAPPLARLPARAPRSALGPQLRRAVARRAYRVSARRLIWAR